MVFQNNILAGVGGQVTDAAYEVSYSCRFNDDDSTVLTRTFDSGGNRKTYSLSFWMKRSEITGYGTAVRSDIAFNTPTEGMLSLALSGTGTDDLLKFVSGVGVYKIYPNMLFRDPGAWYHVLAVMNTAAVQAADRMLIYVNGQAQTSLFTSAYPTLDYESSYNNNVSHTISASGANGMDGYLSQMAFIGGTAMKPSDFGEFNNGVWRPIDITGLDYTGTNSFLLDFADSSDLGNDVSGNDNDFSSSGLAAADRMVDTPTNNYCTFSILNEYTTSSADGALDWVSSTDGAQSNGTIFFDSSDTTGFYFEYIPVDAPSTTAGAWSIGIMDIAGVADGVANDGAYAGWYEFRAGDGGIQGGGGSVISNATWDSQSNGGMSLGETLQVAVKAGKIYFGVNDVWYDSSDDSFANAGEAFTVTDGFYAPSARFANTTSGTHRLNCGNNGSYAFTKPTGLKDISTSNLNESTVKDGTKYFDTILYEGNGAGQKVGQFQPIEETFSVDDSAMFEEADATKLTRTPGSASNQKTWTWSFWLKPSSDAADAMYIFNAASGGGDERLYLQYRSDYQLELGNSSATILKTNRVFKDVSQWYNIILRMDTTQSSASDRVRLYINGVQETSLATDNISAQVAEDSDQGVNNNVLHEIGWNLGDDYYSGYMAQVALIDGSSLAPSSFGEVDSTTNRWIPKDVSGLTFGTNGFLLDYSSKNALGKNANVADPTYTPNPVVFDGSNTYIQSDAGLTGAADGKTVTIALWLKMGASSSDSTRYQILGVTSGYFEIYRNASGKLEFDLYSAAPASIFFLASNTSILNDGAWHHIVFSTNQATSTFKLFIDGSLDSASATTNTDTDFDLTRSDWSVGANQGGSFDMIGEMADFIYDDTFVDLSDAAVLARFITTGGCPVDPGSNGSTAMGAQPLVYFGNSAGILTSGAGDWGGDTGDFSTLVTDVVATGGNAGAIYVTERTFSGDFAVQFTWQGGANPAYMGGYATSEQSGFTSGDADGAVNDMTDSIYLFFDYNGGVNEVDAIAAGTEEASNIFGVVAGEVIKFQRSGSTFKVYEDGTLRHTWTATSSADYTVWLGQSSSSLDWENFKWTDGTTNFWQTNLGTGGGFTETGTLTAGSEVRCVGSNDWTTSGFDTTNGSNQFHDTPTRNFSTLSPAFDQGTTLSIGNTVGTNTSTDRMVIGQVSMPMTAGKWYVEMEAGSGTTGGYPMTGIRSYPSDAFATDYMGGDTYSVGLYTNDATPDIYLNNAVIASLASGGAVSSGDVVQMAFNADTGDLWWGIDNTWLDNSDGDTGNPATGAYPHFNVGSLSSDTQGDQGWLWGFSPRPSSGATAIVNNGSYQYFDGTSLSETADAKGFFRFTPPEGYLALNNDNLTETDSFQTSFSWTKNRDAADQHMLFDRTRGRYLDWNSDSTGGEATDTNSLQRFLKQGQLIGNADAMNTSNESFVSWDWFIETTGSGTSNTTGSLNTTSTLVDATAGVSLSLYDGDGGTDKTIGHGLGITPSFSIIKRMDAIGTGCVVCAGMSANTALQFSESDGAVSLSGGYQVHTSSTLITLKNGTSNGDNVNNSSGRYVCYAWAEIEGFSAMGAYTGNGSTNGPLIFTGMSPAYLLIKKIDGVANNWNLIDNKRIPFNDGDAPYLYADTTAAETDPGDSSQDIDILSNGFKIRNSGNAYNTNGNKYIYLGFASNPFGGASTTPTTAF